MESGGSGGAGATGGSVGSGGAFGTLGLGVCTNPRPLLEGHDTGFVRCEEGWLHRTEKKACPTFVPREGILPPLWEMVDECEQDSDCPGEHAYCGVLGENGQFMSPQPYRACMNGCIEDVDCGPKEICLCGDPVGVCVDAPECTVDSDCPGDAVCLGQSFRGVCGEDLRAFACESEEDECRADSHCPGAEKCTLARVCTDEEAVCGRPFLVDDAERRAAPCERSDWALGGLTLSSGPVEASARQALAEHWQRIGLMEHASIAAFARFSLQLLGLGAPAELIEATNRALVDETRHARVCFALAGHYAGRPIGPGPLDLAGALDGVDAAEILRTVIWEGCVGETLAALEAREAAELAAEPSLREILASIAEDEGQHAELAWRFVQWLLEERPELRGVAEATFREATHAYGDGATEEVSEVDLTAYGVVPRSTSQRLRREALTGVVRPCAEALLAHRRGMPLDISGMERLARADSTADCAATDSSGA